MKTEKLNYILPPELVAQQPPDVRGDCRLLFFSRPGGELVDSRFSRIGEFLLPGDCLVLNDTRVLSARFFARRGTGGKIEGLFLAEEEPGIWTVLLKGARRVKTGEVIVLKDRASVDFCGAEVLERGIEGRCRLKMDTGAECGAILDEIGFAPLPPYIKRDGGLRQAAVDKVRYQTVYARHSGAVAAPTAGLHFTGELMGELKKAGVCFAYVTLHVGIGTFKPVTTENIEEHEMDRERFSINSESAGVINATKGKGGRIIAVGTTSVRALEAAAAGSRIEAAAGATKLFIKPGYEFKIIDGMITNFHLPKSTLLALVGAFAGLEKILAAYSYAVEQRYRFYSYGDAMLII